MSAPTADERVGQPRAELAGAEELDPQRREERVQRLGGGYLPPTVGSRRCAGAHDLARLVGELQLEGIPEAEGAEPRQAETSEKSSAQPHSGTERSARPMLDSDVESVTG